MPAWLQSLKVFCMDSVYTEQILRYLDGEMSTEERERFEELLTRNPPLAEECRRLSMAVDTVKYMGVVEQVKNTHQQLKSEGSITGLSSRRVVPIRRIIRFGMAAAAILLFIFIGIKGWEFYALSPQRLYEQAFVDYELSSSRSTQQPAPPVEAAYLQKDYKKVISLAKGDTTLTADENFFTGLSYLHEEEFAAAIPYLEKTATPGSDKKADAEYYLAMAYLRNRDYDQSITLMEKIRGDVQHPYHEKFTEKYIDKVRMLKWR